MRRGKQEQELKKQRSKLLRAEIIISSNTCLHLMTYNMKHTEFIWPHALKSSHLFWLVNNRENKATCDYQREAQMVIQLGFIQRFVVSVRKDVSYREKKSRSWKTRDETSRIIDKAKSPKKLLFYKIEHLHLIARNFRFHEHCGKKILQDQRKAVIQ